MLLATERTGQFLIKQSIILFSTKKDILQNVIMIRRMALEIYKVYFSFIVPEQQTENYQFESIFLKLYTHRCEEELI